MYIYTYTYMYIWVYYCLWVNNVGSLNGPLRNMDVFIPCRLEIMIWGLDI